MELEVWRRVGEGWRVGAAENKQNWRAGVGLGRPRSEGWRASPGAGAGWVAPKSESCEVASNPCPCPALPLPSPPPHRTSV